MSQGVPQEELNKEQLSSWMAGQFDALGIDKKTFDSFKDFERSLVNILHTWISDRTRDHDQTAVIIDESRPMINEVILKSIRKIREIYSYQIVKHGYGTDEKP